MMTVVNSNRGFSVRRRDTGNEESAHRSYFEPFFNLHVIHPIPTNYVISHH